MLVLVSKQIALHIAMLPAQRHQQCSASASLDGNSRVCGLIVALTLILLFFFVFLVRTALPVVDMGSVSAPPVFCGCEGCVNLQKLTDMLEGASRPVLSWRLRTERCQQGRFYNRPFAWALCVICVARGVHRKAPTSGKTFLQVRCAVNKFGRELRRMPLCLHILPAFHRDAKMNGR